MSGSGANLANGRPLGTSSEPLLVPSADVTAKNLRASLHNRTPSGNYDADGRMQRRAMSILDKVVGSSAADDPDVKNAAPKFTRMVDDSPSMLAQLKSFIYRMRTSSSSSNTSSKSKKVSSLKKSADSAESNPLFRSLGKLCQLIEYSPVPPMVYFLSVLFLIIVLKVSEPVRLLAKFPYLPHLLEALLVATLVVTILWKRSRVFYALARGESPYKHPMDGCLEPYAEHIDERAARVQQEKDELAENHAQLDALRKELAKDPAAHIPGSVLKPSRKAAAMIRDGALGAGYDAEKAAEAEEIRKKERQRESHRLWREKSSGVNMKDVNDEELKKLMKHSATGYRKHTKDLKMKAAPRPPPAVNAFKKASAAVVGASAVAGAFAGLTGNNNSNNSPRGSRENTRDQSGSSGRRDGSGSGGVAMGANGGGGNSFSVFGTTGHANNNNNNIEHSSNMINNNNNTRRSSGGSDISVRTAASGAGTQSPVSRQNSKRFKMHLFRRKQRSAVPIAGSGGEIPVLTTSASLPAEQVIINNSPITYTVPLNGNGIRSRTNPAIPLNNNIENGDPPSGVLLEKDEINNNNNSRRNSKTHSRLPSFSRLSAKRRSKTTNNILSQARPMK